VSVVAEVAQPLRRLTAQLWSGVLAGSGAFIGLVPHVLHHVRPLEGVALLAGTGGTLLFAGIGFVAAIPFLLLLLYRRFGTWRAYAPRNRAPRRP
jgi:hypothetical protein